MRCWCGSKKCIEAVTKTYGTVKTWRELNLHGIACDKLAQRHDANNASGSSWGTPMPTKEYSMRRELTGKIAGAWLAPKHEPMPQLLR
jgi:hypothetical protein